MAAYQKRMDATREKMAAERDRLRELRKRETEKLYRIVGEACCKGAQHLGAALTEVLESESDERTRAFLRQKGML